jgi:myo-inositol-1(or 4)-monophosphatase
MIDKFLNATIEANKQIANLLGNGSKEELFRATSIGAGGDISLRIDLLAEDIFIKNLSFLGNIRSEEKGFISNEGEYEVIIDPIDGSDNLISGVPYFGTSAALKKDDKIIAGVIVNLANKDIFIKDSQGLRKSKLDDLNFKEVSKNPYSKLGLFERVYSCFEMAKILKDNQIKYRSPGAFALSLAYAHDVNFVLYVGKMRIYDIAAGEFFCDNLYKIKRDNILFVSKNKEIFDRMSKFILRD